MELIRTVRCRVHKSPVLFVCQEKKDYAGTLRGVLVFAGMNGDPIGGFLFDHVPFFKGEGEFGRKSWLRQGGMGEEKWEAWELWEAWNCAFS